MMHRLLPAVSLIALAACQPPYGTSSFGVNSYAPQRGPVLTGGAAGTTTAREYTTFNATGAPAVMPAVFTPTPSAKPPPAAPGGVFHEIDVHGGDVGFWNEDPVAKREVATYADRYVERVSLRNGGVITYEMLTQGRFSDESDADLIRSDLALPPFRARGLIYDPQALGHVGPFTYLAQATPGYNCFIFRGKFGGARGEATEEAYGNLCYARGDKDLAAVRAEMLDVLSHARFGAENATALTAAAPAAAAPAAAEPQTVALARCHMAVSFSAAPVAGDNSGSRHYIYADGSYSEEASCACKPDLDYAKLSQFDAVDNVRRLAEARGYTLQKATFAETPALGRELAFEAMAEKEDGEAFLVGRSFYGRCGFSALTTGLSYGDLRKGRKFIASVAAAPASTAAPAMSPAAPAVSDAAITNADGPGNSQEPPPPAVPVTPVAKADAAPAEPAAAASSDAAATAATPAAAVPATLVATKPAAAEAGSGSSMPPAAAPDEVAQRLRRLKLLLDQKLITPEEYEAKRQSIVKSL
jgi:hypothetical protein